MNAAGSPLRPDRLMERLAAFAHRLGYRFQVDFGLAGASDAVEQGDREFPGRHRVAQLRRGVRLVGGE